MASNSPRRRQLLALGNWAFSVKVVDIDETPLADELPKNYVLRLAQAKALAVSEMASPENIIIGSDTTVVDGDSILGKPTDTRDAESMLKQ
ncbi:MAG: Maf family protein, partial [Anaerolineales bacterium]|nr:Maf family protein [Anaerolineales bacterium]